jgi:pyruvate dehydrogenase E1 component
MPDFGQFSTVPLGIGPITSIYQARFMKYLHARGLADTADRKVWCFVGDGEVDEPETMGSIGLAGKERLDNLIWVVPVHAIFTKDQLPEEWQHFTSLNAAYYRRQAA